MKYSIVSGFTDIPLLSEEAILLFSEASHSHQDHAVLTHYTKTFDDTQNSFLKTHIGKTQFHGSVGSSLIFHHVNSQGMFRANILVGLGTKDTWTVKSWMDAVALAIVKAKEIHAQSIGILIPKEIYTIFPNTDYINATIIAVGLSLYEFSQHKSKNDAFTPESVTIYVPEVACKNENEVIVRASHEIDAVVTARDLVNEPSNVMTPIFLADFAASLSRNHTNIRVEIFGPSEMKKMGMNALLAIAKGSDEEPRFIKLDYNPNGKKTLCLVGKGITFDSGGLSLKPESSMETMKCDMAGAAAVLGIFSVLPYIQTDYHVVGLIAATENMPSGKAIKPGDIVTAMNGKTIEIVNTDAEGRVVLADALSYADKLIHPDKIIDLATLTGACMIALGEDIAGYFSNSEQLAKDIQNASLNTGELVWRLPLVDSYEELLKSPIADLRNIGKTRYGGAITGALFIQNFAPEKSAWAHFDIAGPAYCEKGSPLTPFGGTGFAVRLVLQLLSSNNAN